MFCLSARGLEIKKFFRISTRLQSSISTPIEVLKKLRSQTNSPLGDCQRALRASNNKLPEAKDWLRKNSRIISSKLSKRKSENSVVRIDFDRDRRVAALLHFDTETDFVAKNKLFLSKLNAVSKNFVDLGKKKLKGKEDSDELSNRIKNFTDEMAGKLKENVIFRKGKILKVGENSMIGGYIHAAYSDGCGQSGAIVSFTHKAIGEEKHKEFFMALGAKLGMQIVAMKPRYLKKSLIPSEFVKKEAEYFLEETEKNFLKRSKKVNQEHLKNITTKKLDKSLGEICLLDQTFVIEEETKISVAAALDGFLKSQGLDGEIKITDFSLGPDPSGCRRAAIHDARPRAQTA